MNLNNQSAWRVLLFALLLLPISVNAEEEPEAIAESDEAVIAAHLEQTKKEIFTLFNEEKFQQIADQYCHEQITCIWHDGTASTGRQGVVDFFAKIKGFIDVMKVDPTTTDRAIFEDGKFVVSVGDLGDTYVMASGQELKLKSKWMATLTYDNDKWQLISFASLTSAFENEVIDGFLLMRTIYAGAGGLVAGILLTLFLRRKKRAN